MGPVTVWISQGLVHEAPLQILLTGLRELGVGDFGWKQVPYSDEAEAGSSQCLCMPPSTDILGQLAVVSSQDPSGDSRVV